MKCVKNKKTGEVTRVSDEAAIQKCGGLTADPTAAFQYVPKSEWKATRTAK